MSEHPKNRRIDRILDPSYVQGLEPLTLDEVRERRDECLAEREYLSLLRRLLQGRAEILRAELEARSEGGGGRKELIDRLSQVLAGDEPITSRGEAVRISVPEDEMLLARRQIEALAGDAGISDPATLDDQALTAAVEALSTEERTVSDARRAVIDAYDAVQDELKRRFKDDPTLALR